jgi:glutamate-1-semialdehyde 2,1-aminomutase
MGGTATALADRLADRAQRVLVGGVSRGFNNLPEFGPLYVESAEGAWLRDVDGTRYLDCVMGWGSLLLGHDPAVVRDALRAALDSGFLYQQETQAHVELAELVHRHVPCADRVRFTGSGLEATLFAIRLARAYTGRQKIIKCEGHFHGLHDSGVLSNGATPPGEPMPDGTVVPGVGSAGVLESDATLVVPFNDPDALEKAVRAHGDDVAAVILEPVALNMGCVFPTPGYLESVREITDRAGIVLIFDEVLTGFRVALGGAQERLGVVPDLACFSKAFGCGQPIAALAGRSEVMSLLGPPGVVPMSGTNSARVLSVVGTLAAMRTLAEPGFHPRLAALNDRMVAGFTEVLTDAGVPGHVVGCGGRISVFFGLAEPPRTFRELSRAWNRDYHVKVYRRLMSHERVYGFIPLGLAPDPINLSVAHGDREQEELLDRFASAVRAVPYRDS